MVIYNNNTIINSNITNNNSNHSNSNHSNNAAPVCHMSQPSYHSSCYLLPLSVIILFFVLILIVNLVGNTIVVSVISSKRRMQTFTNWLILNLALADLCVALFCIPLEIPLEINNKWIYGKFFCRIFYPLQSSTVYGSIYTLVVLSCSRYWAILHPFRRQPTRFTAKLSIALIWIVSIMLIIPYIMGLEYEDGHCNETWSDKQARSYTIVTFTLQYVFPLTVISVAYTLIIYDLTVRQNPSASHGDKQKEKENKKLIKLLLIITITFALCVLPYHVVALSYTFVDDVNSFKYINDVSLGSYILLYLNSAFNPIIYNVFSSNFRRGFRESYRRTSTYLFRTNERDTDRFLKLRSNIMVRFCKGRRHLSIGREPCVTILETL